MPEFRKVSDKDIQYYLRRSDLPVDHISVGKEFVTHTGTAAPQRYVYKQIEGNEELEVAEIEQELVLKSSPKGRDEVKLTVFGSDGRNRSFVIQKYRYNKPISGQSVSFLDSEWKALTEFLEKIKFADFSDANRFQLSQNSIPVPDVVSSEERKLLDSISSLEGEDRANFIERLTTEHTFSREDLNIISGRKTGLEEFRARLYSHEKWGETNWQAFFERNPWIFGHGLDYRFLSLLQREASVSDIDTDGSDTVKVDFLMGSTDFTVLVEIKEPETELTRGVKKHRSRAWSVSMDLVDSISQILTQKAEWLIKSRANKTYDSDGAEITQKAIDTKAILVIGKLSSLAGSDREMETKKSSFELFRRDSRNIEIVTFDELYDRAFYIVNQRLPTQGDR